MHYKIKEFIIKSETAAKSYKQPSKEILKWISKQRKVEYILDYGCGKLRYAPYLRKKVIKKLVLVDSKEQLTKKQKILESSTTIKDFVKRKWKKNTEVVALNEFKFRNIFELSICINVLSAIPSKIERNNAIRKLKDSLNDKGQCLIVTQYCNSYYKKALINKDNQIYLDGWIGKNRHSFYGIINQVELELLVRRNGLFIRKKWKNSGSAYVIATKILK